MAFFFQRCRIDDLVSVVSWSISKASNDFEDRYPSEERSFERPKIWCGVTVSRFFGIPHRPLQEYAITSWPALFYPSFQWLANLFNQVNCLIIKGIS